MVYPCAHAKARAREVSTSRYSCGTARTASPPLPKAKGTDELSPAWVMQTDAAAIAAAAEEPPLKPASPMSPAAAAAESRAQEQDHAKVRPPSDCGIGQSHENNNRRGTRNYRKGGSRQEVYSILQLALSLTRL